MKAETVVTIALCVTLWVLVGGLAAFAWHDRNWMPAIPLSVIWLVSTIAFVWLGWRWGG